MSLLLRQRERMKEREEKESEREMVKEALVVCGDKNLNVGVTIWDMETGDHLLHIPTCACLPGSFVSLGNHFLIASQVHKYGSVGGGALIIWPFNKPQAPLRNYPVEALGPLACTKDRLYLAGGASSGNAYIWQVSGGKMVKSWRAHQISVCCLAFSNDNSFLISGSDDGEIRVWSMISLLEIGDYGNEPTFFYSLLAHQSRITGLLSTFGASSPTLVSSSLDGTCKVWDLIEGRFIRTCAFPLAITAITLDPEEQLLFSGTADGRIFLNTLDVGLDEDSVVVSEDHLMVLIGHKGSITALSFSLSGLFLISASEDCTACLWDVKSWMVTRTFNHMKGRITNIVTIPGSSLQSVVKHQGISHQIQPSLLDKFLRPTNASRGTITLLRTYCSVRDGHTTTCFQSSTKRNQQILDLEQGSTPEAIEMEVETIVEYRLSAIRMAKHISDKNSYLWFRLLDLMQFRLSGKRKKRASISRKKIKVGKLSTGKKG